MILGNIHGKGKSGRNHFVVAAMTLAFAAILVACYFFVRLFTDDIMMRTIRLSTESAHGDMVLVASRAIETEITSLISSYKAAENSVDWPAFAKKAEFVSLDNKVRSLVDNTTVVKLKVYATSGITAYSSDPAQIGEARSELEQVVHALRGRSTSQVSSRKEFMSFDGKMQNVEIISSYHPLTDRKGETIGVIEIYSDRTREFGAIDDFGNTQLAKLMVLLSLSLALWLGNIMYGVLRHRASD
jgi:hypothetical protein